MKTAQKISQDRLSRLNTLLSELSPKEFAMIEAMVSSGAKEAGPEDREDPIEVILETETGKNLMGLLNQLRKTEIVFQLSQIQSFDIPINLSWEIEDVNFYSGVDPGPLGGKSNTKYYSSSLAVGVVEMLQDDHCEGISNLPAYIQQELDKERKKVEAVLEALGKKKHSFVLKELPQLQIGAIFSFSNLEFEENSSGEDLDVCFMPNLDIKSKGKLKLADRWICILEDMLVDAYHNGELENDLPKDIAAQIKATDALQEKITKLTNTLANKHKWDPHCLLEECCDRSK